MSNTTSLEQRTFPFNKLRFTIVGTRELVVEHSTLLRSTRQAFPLYLIDPSPIFHRNLPIGWVVITGIFLVLTFTFIFGTWGKEDPVAIFFVLIMLSLFLACLYNTIKLSRSTIHFRNANKSAIMLNLFRNKPTELIVDEFIETLHKRIESFRTPIGSTNEETVALFVKHLEYLLENDVLHQSEYDAAIQRLDVKSSGKKVFEIVR
jgi:hypothetical protein